MGDKYRSENQKPVNNPLLSGAGHGFPFETFQGSSLLVPVSQENSALLTEQVVEPEKLPATTESSASAGDASAPAETKTAGPQASASAPASNQGYVRLFTSLFGGKQEPETCQEKGTEQASSNSTPRSFSPYVHVPNIQTVTPALQVPGSGEARCPEVNADAAEMKPQGVGDVFTLQQQQQPPFPPPYGNFGPGKGDTGAYSFTPATMFRQSEPPAISTTSVPLFPVQSPPQSNESHVYAYGSAAPPPPPSNPNAPPLYSGSTTKNYRLCHNKRPVYAPIPGLTLSQPSSAPFMPATAETSKAVPSVFPPGSNPPPPGGFPTFFTPGAAEPQTAPPPAAAPPPPTQTPIQSLFQPQPTPTPVQTFVPAVPSPGQTFAPTQSVASHPVVPVAPQPVAPPPAQPVAPPPAQPAAPSPAPPPLPQPVAPSPIQPPVQPPVLSPSSLPYPPAGSDKQSLFAPISRAGSIPNETNPPVLNPVAVHPAGNPQPVEEKVASPTVVPPSLNHLAHVGRTGIGYRPPYHHWFFKKEVDSKEIWRPFSMTDSVALEQAYQSANLDENTVIATDGGRYDVNIIRRTRTAAYWTESPKEVRRCSWFCKSLNDARFRPYDENTAYHLEEEYKKCVTNKSWKRKVELGHGDYVVMYSSTNILHFEKGVMPLPNEWEALPDGSEPMAPPTTVVKRGVQDDFDIDDGEAPKVDHLIFVVHGIGSVCDLKFRTIEEAVDDFRSISHQLIKVHFNNSMKQGLVNRIEVLPVSWHSHLHGETTGLDKKLENITLKSIPRLRHFTNDTLLDILFYTSPVYCQNIVQRVGQEMKDLYEKFRARNPSFKGGVSLVGHSLGSLILFDMLCHQAAPQNPQENHLEAKKDDGGHGTTRRLSGFIVGGAGTGQPCIEYPQLSFEPVAFFALGSPIGMFVTVRGIDSLGLDFKLPTCQRFFNIFHPFDPVAYRVEALINPELSDKRPVLIPHHKGRKRMHLELKETITRVGADLKQRLVDSIRSTWNTVYHLTSFGRADDGLEEEVDKVIEKQIARQRSESVGTCLSEQEVLDCDLGHVNMGRRIDYVLQEAPLESFNEYVSAVRSHLVYWDSEDTVLMILKELYNSVGITPDVDVCSGNEMSGRNSPSSPPSPSMQSVGWSTSGEDHGSKTKQIARGRAPSYGFINN